MKNLIKIVILLLPTFIWGQTVNITKAGGWFETAYVEWQTSGSADSYNVYYSGNGVTDKKIDEQLIRTYSSKYRADIVGLQAGSYTIKVVPVKSGAEGTVATSSAVSVKAYERNGFAFANNRIPGAYKADGTPKDGAVILYVSEDTKNTVSLDVTGATSNPCVGIQTILEGIKKGEENRPIIMRFVGQISDLSYLDKGDLVVENSNNNSSYVTLEGVGEDATIDGWGIRLKNSSNIEVRNIGIMNVNSSEGDNLGLQQNNEYVWIHNVDFFYGDAGGDSDQAKGDGALDCKKSTYVTFSYNHFWDTGKSNLLGLSEGTTEGLYITYHHNWYDHSDSRHPRVRFYSAHVYNNYYDGNAKYGVGSTLGSSVFIESNYFRNCKYPMLTSMQGSDVWDDSEKENDYSDMPTFSKEDGGTIKAFDNYMIGHKRFVPYGSSDFDGSTKDFDAVVVSSRNEEVSSSIKSSYGSNTYNNFDINSSVMYSYDVESPEEAKATVMQYAGRMNGGDFQWTFDNSIDDESYAVNTGLKSKLSSYKTSLLAIQGDGNNVVIIVPESSSSENSSSSSVEGSESSSSIGNIIVGDIVHNFTLSGLSSSFFNITGNLSTSKGSVSYNGLNLTQCLKIESATEISFTLEAAAIISLVFNEDFNGSIKINGINYTAINGIVTASLESGSYSITKGDTSNLFYMDVKFAEDITFANINSSISKMFLNGSLLNIKVENNSLLRIDVYSIVGEKMFSIGKNNFEGMFQLDLNSSLNKSGLYIVNIIENNSKLKSFTYTKRK